MDLRFILPNLRQLELAGAEVLAVGLTAGERPPHGVAGLVDWRLCGRISSLLRSGFATGRVGEVLLLPGKPRLPFDKIILFGTGRPEEFGEEIYRSIVERMLATMEGLRARSAVVQLPGRHFSGVAPERAADVVLELTTASTCHDLWTLIEPSEAQRVVMQHMIQERRRVRH